jgi:hypothetical protein
MTLEQIRDEAWREAVHNVPNANFGISMQEYGETEEQVMKSIEDSFRDELFYSAMRQLHSQRPQYKYESLNRYYFELIKALEDVGAAVYESNDTPWIVQVEFAQATYRLRVSGSVKMGPPILDNVSMRTEPNETAQLIALIQDVQVPGEEILKESMKLYSCQKIVRTSAHHLIDDILHEHSCSCSIYVCENEKMKIMVYGNKPANKDMVFTFRTDLGNIRKDLLKKLAKEEHS